MKTDAQGLSRLQATLLSVEEKIALVDSLTPNNLGVETAELAKAFASGQLCAPQFRYAALASSAGLDALSAILAAAQLALTDERLQASGGPLLRLVEGRVDELAVELRMLRVRGTTALASLAAERFPFTALELSEADRTAQLWLQLEPEAPGTESPRSLLKQLSEKLRDHVGPGRELRLVERKLASRAAAGGDILYVGHGQVATESEAARVWVHEVCGHLLPRLAARHEPVPFALGTPGCSADEEGWALRLEEQAGLLSHRRKREVALRFVIARTYRESGEQAALELCLSLVTGGQDANLVATTVCRAARGGGFCREVIYLPAYQRVTRALDKKPELESYFQRGRASVSALETLVTVFPQG